MLFFFKERTHIEPPYYKRKVGGFVSQLPGRGAPTLDANHGPRYVKQSREPLGEPG